MALIERFTPGGNLYPDGSSTFAVLVTALRRMAEQRDVRDAAITSAWKAGDTTTRDAANLYAAGVATSAETNAKAHATTAAQAAELNAKTHANTAATTAKTDANAYTDASFAATAAGGATDAAVDAAVNRATLAGRIVPDSIISGLIANLASATRAAVQAMVRDEAGITLRGLGTTDDAPAITAALATSGVRRVTIPAGTTANVVTSVTVPAHKILVLEAGATLKRTGTGTGQVVRLSTGATLTGGGTIDGAGLTSYVVGIIGDRATVLGVTITGSVNYGIGNTGWADLRVEGCEFTNNPSYALLNENTSAARTVFMGNRIRSGGRGVMFKSCGDGTVTGNIIEITGGVGIEVFGATATRVTVTGNVVKGAAIGISLASATYCTVTGNTVQNFSSIGIENAEGAAYNTITGNAISGGAGVGIHLTSGSGGLKPFHHVTVTGNTINGTGSYGIGTEYGNRTTILGNIITDAGAFPMYINNSPTAFMIAMNTVHVTDAGYNGIAIRLTGTGHSIIGNTVDFTETTTSSGVGIRVEGGSRSTLQNNLFRGGGTGISVNNATGTVVNNNRTEGTTVQALQFYGTANTSTVLTHLCRLASGVSVTNQNATPITGPVVLVA